MHHTLNESIRSRLEALNRAPLPPGVPRAHAEPAATPAWSAPETASAFKPDSVITQRVPGLLHSGQLVENSSGQHVRICIPVETLWSNSTQLIAARQQYLQSQLETARQASEPAIAIES